MSTPIPDEMRKQAATDATKAAKALDRDDWKAALKLLASAVQMDPFRAETIALLDRVLDEAGSKAEAFIKKGGPEETWAGFQGIKAYAAHRRGDFKTALSELKDLTQNFDTNFFPEAWGLDWLTEDAIRAAGPIAARVPRGRIPHAIRNQHQLTAWSREQFGRAVACARACRSGTRCRRPHALVQGADALEGRPLRGGHRGDRKGRERQPDVPHCNRRGNGEQASRRHRRRGAMVLACFRT